MLKRLEFIEILPYLEEAKKSGLVFCNKTIYYGMYIDNNLVGFCGVLKYANKAIMKNAFVLPKYRGNRYGEKMLLARINMLKCKIEATCTPMSLRYYLQNGFVQKQAFSNGCVKVYYENI
jgi:GNAT superfamily N-acetyltransferase